MRARRFYQKNSFQIGIIIIIIFISIAVPFIGNTPFKENIRHAVESTGLKEVHFTGYAILGCREDDFIRLNFKAVNVNKQNITGVVCGGPLVGYEVRYR